MREIVKSVGCSANFNIIMSYLYVLCIINGEIAYFSYYVAAYWNVLLLHEISYVQSYSSTYNDAVSCFSARFLHT